MWYHWLNGKKIHERKVINSIVIRAQLDISKTCTSKKIET
jgi:hypothetical protein